MSHQPYTESSWGVARLLGKDQDRRMFLTSLGKKYYLVDRFFPVVRIAVVFLILFLFFVSTPRLHFLVSVGGLGKE